MLRTVLRDAGVDGRAATASCAGNVQVQGLRGAAQPVQVRLELPDRAAHGEHGLENAVTAGGALVRGHQLRLRGVGQPAGRERGVKENQHHGGRRSHGSSLVAAAPRISCGQSPWPERVRGCAQSGGSPVLWPFPLAGTVPAWLIVLLGAADLVIRVLAVGIIPGNRRPTTAMAWLLGIFFVPFVGLVLFLLFGNFRLSSRRRQQQETGQRKGACRHLGARRRRKRIPRPGMGEVRRGTEPPAGLPSHGGRQLRGPHPRLPGLDPGHDRGRAQGQEVRQRRVLHHEHGPRHR